MVRESSPGALRLRQPFDHTVVQFDSQTWSIGYIQITVLYFQRSLEDGQFVSYGDGLYVVFLSIGDIGKGGACVEVDYGAHCRLYVVHRDRDVEGRSHGGDPPEFGEPSSLNHVWLDYINLSLGDKVPVLPVVENIADFPSFVTDRKLCGLLAAFIASIAI